MLAGRKNNIKWLENPLFLNLQRFKLYLSTFFWVGVFGKFEEFLEISSFCKFPINVLLELVPVFRHKVLLKAWYTNNQSWYIQTITPDIQSITPDICKQSLTKSKPIVETSGLVESPRTPWHNSTDRDLRALL